VVMLGRLGIVVVLPLAAALCRSSPIAINNDAQGRQQSSIAPCSGAQRRQLIYDAQGRQQSSIAPCNGTQRRQLIKLAASSDGLRLPLRMTPSAIDQGLSAAGAGTGIAVLTLMQHFDSQGWIIASLQGVYVTTLCSSAIVLNYDLSPPSFSKVFWATFVPAAFTIALLKLTGSGATARPLSVAMTMCFFKSFGCAFPPACALAATFLDNPRCTPMGWAYVGLPCVGNAILWGVAWLFSRLRAMVADRLMCTK